MTSSPQSKRTKPKPNNKTSGDIGVKELVVGTSMLMYSRSYEIAGMILMSSFPHYRPNTTMKRSM